MQPQREHNRAKNQTHNQRHRKISLQALRRSLPPGQQRSKPSQRQQQQPDRNIHFVEKRRPNADPRSRHPLRKHRKQRARQNCHARNQQNQVVKQKARLARNDRIELILTLQIIAILDIRREANNQNHRQKPDKPISNARLRKRMHRTHNSTSRQRRPQNAQHERQENEPDVPNLHHAALFLHYHRVQKRRARQPRQQRRILDRGAAQIPPPAEHRVRPMRAEQNSRRLEAPRDHRPLARQVNPLLTRIPRQERAQRKRKRNRESRIPRIQIRRMNHHLGILQQRRQSIPIRPRVNRQRTIRARRSQHLKWARHKIVQRQKENLHAGQHHADVRHQLAILVPIGKQRRENVNRQQKAPEQ